MVIYAIPYGSLRPEESDSIRLYETAVEQLQENLNPELRALVH